MNTTCPYCHCITIKANGTRNSKQRFRCLNPNCRKCWTKNNKPSKQKVWRKFLEGYQVDELACYHRVSEKTISRIIKSIPDVTWREASNPEQVQVVIIDATYWGWTCAEMVAMDAWTGQILYCLRLSAKETIADYVCVLANLSKLGYTGIRVVVTDGRPGVGNLVESLGLLYQKCQFHQIKTVIKYLTSKPKLKPNWQLLVITKLMTQVDKKTFQTLLNKWYEYNQEWLKEQTILPDGKKQFIHRKTRSAYNSLSRNPSALFVCRDFPSLHIPNTTNKLEGMFGNIKPIIAIHRGIHRNTKLKAFEYLCLESR